MGDIYSLYCGHSLGKFPDFAKVVLGTTKMNLFYDNMQVQMNQISRFRKSNWTIKSNLQSRLDHSKLSHFNYFCNGDSQLMLMPDS